MMITKAFIRKSKKIIAFVFVFAVFLTATAEEEQYNILDWSYHQLSPIHPVFINSAHIEVYDHPWQDMFAQADSLGKKIAFILVNTTGPYDGDKSYALQAALDEIDNKGYKLDFVFADFESDTEDQNCELMASMVKNHTNPNINSAYVGNYDEYPGATTLAAHYGDYDRTARHNFYMNSGMNVAMPSLYPYSPFINHATRSDIFGTNLCVSTRHALFWTPLEEFMTAKRALPASHKIIPWVAGYVNHPAYPSPIPSKEDCRALIKHIRLRGTDGYYSWQEGDNTNYIDRVDYREDILNNGWAPLNNFFERPGQAVFLNSTTNKTGGVEWSGARKGNQCCFVFSNFTTSPAQVTLPSGIENLPASSPVIPAGEHMQVNYVVGPLAYWKMDEQSGTVISDAMANGFNCSSSSSLSFTSGKSGNALLFNGSNTVVSCGDKLDLGTGNRTISLWFKTNSNVDYQCLVSKGHSVTSNQHAIQMVYGKIRVLMDINGTDYIIHSSNQLNDGNWHHIAVAIDRQNEMRLFVDGEFNSAVDISPLANIDANNTYDFLIGYSHNGYYFDGAIDEVKMYSDLLTDQEIFDEFACEANIRFDERSGNIANDDSIYSYVGNVNNMVSSSWKNGRFGSYLDFDGIDDTVNFGDILDLGLKDRTISLLFKTSSSVDNQCLISKGHSVTSNLHAITMIYGKIRVLMDINGTDYMVYSSNQLNDGNWHHIAVVINRQNEMQLFVDGEFNSAVDISPLANIDASNTYDFLIGQSQNIYYFDGAIDEVKLYNKALTAQEVSNICEAYK